MLRVGLTGGIGSGKSAVAELLAAYGAVIIDADLLAREVVEPGTAGFAAVAARFGPGVVVDGRLDRAALGARVFSDPEARRDLERIIHPEVRRRAAELEGAADSDGIVVHVIPLLVETGQEDGFDVVVVVDVDRNTQIERLVETRGLDREQAVARVDAQADPERRRAVADAVIDNRGTRAELRDQVDRLWSQWTASVPPR